MFLVMRIFILKKNHEEKKWEEFEIAKRSTDTNIININE